MTEVIKITQYDLGLVIGSDGRGITSIEKTDTTGLEDTYTITYTDETTSTFMVTNGAKGDTGATGATGATGKGITSITKTGTSGKVDTYTITYSDNSTSTFTVTNGNDGVGIQSIEKTGSVGLVDNYRIHFTDSTYYDYQVTNGSGGSADIVTSWESTLSDTKVPSEKLTKDSLDAKQDSLVSGTNIKTVNNNSLLGSGNITIQGGGGDIDVIDNLNSQSSTDALSANQGRVLKESLPKQIILTSSEYNPDVGDTITLTCTVKDAFGNPVSGYTCQLYKDGVSMGSSYSSTTNQNGTCTFSYTTTTDGLTLFSVDSAECNVGIGLATAGAISAAIEFINR